MKSLRIYFFCRKGITLLEILLTVSLITLLAVISIPIFRSTQIRNDLEIAKNTVLQDIYRGEILARANDGDSSWGLKIQSGNITLFKGNNYASRDQSFDENSFQPASLSFSGINEIVFAKMSGFPLTTGAVTITSNTNETRTINLNSKGNAS